MKTRPRNRLKDSPVMVFHRPSVLVTQRRPLASSIDTLISLNSYLLEHLLSVNFPFSSVGITCHSAIYLASF